LVPSLVPLKNLSDKSKGRLVARKPAKKKQSAAKEQGTAKKRDRDQGVALLDRSLALEYLVEVMFANDFANAEQADLRADLSSDRLRRHRL
jgi:hypothetical protein